MSIKLKYLGVGSVVGTMLSSTAFADLFEYQVNELILKANDRYEIPFTGESSREKGLIYTFQHASAWKYGDNYGFLDRYELDETGEDLYGEFYANFSLGKMTGRPIRFGPISDVGILAGYNWGRDTKVRKYLPGVRLSWDLPQFAFLNTDFTLYLDDNAGADRGGVPEEDDSYMIDINWAAPFDIGRHRFSIEGHVEYIGQQENEFGDKVSWWVLAQPQFRYDLGKTWFNKADRLFVGVEWQYWKNKLGDPDTDENILQAIVVGRL